MNARIIGLIIEIEIENKTVQKKKKTREKMRLKKN